MNDPATAETWQTAIGKDFGGMAQGDNNVGTQDRGYVRNVPLPRVPLRQSTSLGSLPDYSENQYGVPTYITPRSLVESAAYAFSPAWQAIAVNS